MDGKQVRFVCSKSIVLNTMRTGTITCLSSYDGKGRAWQDRVWVGRLINTR